MRSVAEWIGKTDDSMPPPNVRLRVFDKHDGICHLCGTPILPGQKSETDHVIPIWQGGENRESNLAPAHKKCHAAKSAADRKQQAKERRVRKRHLGIEANKAVIPGSRKSPWKRTIDGRTIRRDVE